MKADALQGKVVIVTGGGSGIGQAAVDLLVAAGSSVMIADLNAPAEPVAGAQLAFRPTDVSREDQVEAMVREALDRFGRLDGAINCAGLPPKGRALHEIGVDQWDRCGDVNLKAMFLSMKHQIIAMRGHGGSIVAVSSAAAVSAMPGSADYCAMKAGVTGLVRAAAIDYAALGIRVNGIMPGGTDTPMFRVSCGDNADFSGIVASLPIRRIATPREIAACALWLISDDASYVTGANIPVDGGLTAM